MSCPLLTQNFREHDRWLGLIANSSGRNLSAIPTAGHYIPIQGFQSIIVLSAIPFWLPTAQHVGKAAAFE
jgi:hypothetical protein